MGLQTTTIAIRKNSFSLNTSFHNCIKLRALLLSAVTLSTLLQKMSLVFPQRSQEFTILSKTTHNSKNHSEVYFEVCFVLLMLKLNEIRCIIESTYFVCSYLYCCDRKSRAACAQSFAPWQQATIEIMLAISVTVAFSRYTYDGVILRAHGRTKRTKNAYTGVQKERTIFNCIWTSGEKGSQLVCCTIFLSQLSLNVFVIWEFSIQYSYQIFVLVNRF